MELSLSLTEHLAQASFLHRRLCPRQVLGVRMARLACLELQVDPALHHKRIFVYMENGHCAADGVTAVTHASPTNALMQLVPYGKMAATFVDLVSRRAVRVAERAGCREAAVALLPDVSSGWAAQLQGYQLMPDELLLSWNEVALQVQPPVILGKHKVTCQRCGDFIHEYREVQLGGQTLCRPCAYGTYYEIISPSISSEAERSVALTPGA